MGADVRLGVRLAAAVLAFLFLSGMRDVIDYGRPANIEIVSFSQAPPPVQDYLIKVMAACSASADIVRANASFDVGPIGGAGQRDYFFEFGADYWPGPTDFGHNPPGTGCLSHFAWSTLSMDLGDGRYKSFFFVYPDIFYNGPQFRLFYEDRKFHCPGAISSRWYAYGKITIWDRATRTFRPISACVTREQAMVWANARGYREDIRNPEDVVVPWNLRPVQPALRPSTRR